MVIVYLDTLVTKMFRGKELDGNMWKKLKKVQGVKSETEKAIPPKDKATPQGQPL